VPSPGPGRRLPRTRDLGLVRAGDRETLVLAVAAVHVSETGRSLPLGPLLSGAAVAPTAPLLER
jgi:hypothetical protein